MAKFAFFLVFLAVLVDISLSGFIRPNFGRVEFDIKQCSQIKPFLPKPKSGCCGQHAAPRDNRHADSRKGNYYKPFANENPSAILPEKYIYGGKPTGIAQYPWLVRVTVNKNTEERKVCYKRDEGPMICQLQDVTTFYSCGGSLVSLRHVITAAHCVDHPIRNNNDVNVTLAEYNTASYFTDWVGSERVMNLILHPEKIYMHSDYRHHGIYENDIAILRLQGTPPYTDFIRPICLPPFNINGPGYEGSLLTISGWGYTESNHSSPIKLSARVRMVTPDTCRHHYPHLTAGVICAASTSGQDVCNGDSGGPIMLEEDGVFYLVGVVSSKKSGAPCGSSVPTKYTNVFSYVSWIQKFIEDEV